MADSNVSLNIGLPLKSNSTRVSMAAIECNKVTSFVIMLSAKLRVIRSGKRDGKYGNYDIKFPAMLSVSIWRYTVSGSNSSNLLYDKSSDSRFSRQPMNSHFFSSFFEMSSLSSLLQFWKKLGRMTLILFWLRFMDSSYTNQLGYSGEGWNEFQILYFVSRQVQYFQLFQGIQARQPGQLVIFQDEALEPRQVTNVLDFLRETQFTSIAFPERFNTLRLLLISSPDILLSKLLYACNSFNYGKTLSPSRNLSLLQLRMRHFNLGTISSELMRVKLRIERSNLYTCSKSVQLAAFLINSSVNGCCIWELLKVIISMEPKRRKLAEKVLQNHVQLIASFLPHTDFVNLKQVNRMCYYNLTVFDIWSSMKWHVAEIKWQDVDLDLEEEEKPNDKNTRNIRIHSLNKRMSQEALIKNVKRPAQRFPSHAKKQDSFARTETLGFRRLGLTKNHDYLLELPDKLDLSNLTIRLNDPIGKNLERAQMASDIVDRWLDYHKKISQLPEEILTLSHWKQKQTMHQEYYRRFSKQTYQQLLINCQKLTNLDDTLKKKLKIFNEKHRIVMQNITKIESVRKSLEKSQELVKQLQNQEGIRYLEAIQQIVENFQQLRESASQLVDNHMISFIGKVEPHLDNYLAARDYRFSAISVSQQKQLELEVILSIIDKTLKLQGQVGKPQHQIIIRRWQYWRHAADRLLKMAKYFTKVRQQLKGREGKTSDAAAIQEIKKFLRTYEDYGVQFQAFDERNRQLLDQQMQKFKSSIDELKTRIKDRDK